MACDSQYSYTSSESSKRTDAVKLEIVEFENETVPVMESGIIAHSKRFVKIFQQLAAGIEVTDDWTIPKTAQEAMRALKNEMRAQNCDCSLAELDDKILRECIKVECMFAFFYEGEKHVYTISLAMTIAERMKAQYVAIGCGAGLAEYLLGTNLAPGIPDYHANLIAVHAIESVMTYDFHCSGQTVVVEIKDRSIDDEDIGTTHIYQMSAEDINEYARAFKTADALGRNHRNHLLGHMYDEPGKEEPDMDV